MNALSNKHVRDLAWAINSPSLCDLSELFAWQDREPWFTDLLIALDNNPAPLMEHLANYSDYILGSYFEGLWHFYFQQHPDFELLAKNVQLHGEKGTVGELDLIVQNKSSMETLHIELACKFYCNIAQSGQLEPLHHWVGPALKDKLDEKYGKLLNKQLPLIKHPLAIEFLESKAITVDTSIAIIKGRLFYHQAEKLSWYTLNDTHELNPKLRYLPLNKQDWFADKLLPSDGIVLNPIDLKAYIASLNLERPIQVAAFNNTDHEEVARFFIAPEHWLALAEDLVAKL